MVIQGGRPSGTAKGSRWCYRFSFNVSILLLQEYMGEGGEVSGVQLPELSGRETPTHPDICEPDTQSNVYLAAMLYR